MDHLLNPKELLIQVLRAVDHMAVRMLAVAAPVLAMSVGYWLVVIKDSNDSGKIDFRKNNQTEEG